MNTLISDMFVMCSVGTVLWTVVRWIRAADLHGSHSRAAPKTFRRIQWASDMWWVLGGVALALMTILLVTIPFTGLLGRLEIVAVAFLAITTVTTLTVLRTPGILFLGSSSNIESRRLLAVIKRASSYRTITLIAPETHWLRRLVYFVSGLRARESDDWLAVVEQLATIVPVVVLDARTPTSAVIEEARYLFQRGLHDRTLFVTAPDGSAPVLEAIGEPGPGIPIDARPAEECVTAVRSKLQAHARAMARARPRPTFSEALRQGLAGGCSVGAGYLLAAIAALVVDFPVTASIIGTGDDRLTIVIPAISQTLGLGALPILGMALSRIARRPWWAGALFPWLVILATFPVHYVLQSAPDYVVIDGLLVTYAALGAAFGMLLERHRPVTLALISAASSATALLVGFVIPLSSIRLFAPAFGASTHREVALQAVGQFFFWVVYGAAMGAAIQWLDRDRSLDRPLTPDVDAAPGEPGEERAGDQK
jgi:hypothetical protein